MHKVQQSFDVDSTSEENLYEVDDDNHSPSNLAGILEMLEKENPKLNLTTSSAKLCRHEVKSASNEAGTMHWV